MATPNEIYKITLENREALNQIFDKAKKTGDFDDAGVLVDSDLVRITRGGITYRTTVGAIKAASGGGDTNVQSDWATIDNQDDSYILNKPENLSDFNNDLDPVDVTADAYSSLDTGLVTGGVVTINSGDNTKFDVSAGTGILMNWTDPSNPIREVITWTAFTAEAVPDLSEPFTSLYIGSGGTLVKVSGVLSTPQTRRQRIELQVVEHANGFFISNVAGSSRPAYQVVDSILDYLDFNGNLNKGNVAEPNGANLNINKTEGQTCSPFINRVNDLQNPTILDNATISNLQFFYMYRDGVGGFNIMPATEINPNFWDDGTGVLNTMTNQEFSIQRFYYIGGTNQVFITYGQAEYQSMLEAKSAIFAENPELSTLVNVATFTTAIVVKDATTDLTDLADAEFVDITIPGAGGGSGGGGGDMNKADYDTLNTGNSVDTAQSLNGFTEADFVFLDEFPFDLAKRVSKYPGNIAYSLEVNDMIVNYWWSTTLFIKQAQYNGGDDSLLGSYTIIDSIEF